MKLKLDINYQIIHFVESRVSSTCSPFMLVLCIYSDSEWAVCTVMVKTSNSSCTLACVSYEPGSRTKYVRDKSLPQRPMNPVRGGRWGGRKLGGVGGGGG